MRKVFLFWIIILFVLLAGAVTIIYSKAALKTEKEKEADIIKELVEKEEENMEITTFLPSGPEIEEDLPAFELPEPVPDIIPEEQAY